MLNQSLRSAGTPFAFFSKVPVHHTGPYQQTSSPVYGLVVLGLQDYHQL